MLRITHFLGNRFTDGGVVLSLTRRQRFISQKDYLLLICVRRGVNSRAIVRREGLGKLKKYDHIGNRTRDLLVCSIVRQPTTVPR
jgi:hypothetical protein